MNDVSVLVHRTEFFGVGSNNRGRAYGSFLYLGQLGEEEKDADSNSGASHSQIHVLNVLYSQYTQRFLLDLCKLTVREFAFSPLKKALDAINGPMKDATPFQLWQN